MVREGSSLPRQALYDEIRLLVLKEFAMFSTLLQLSRVVALPTPAGTLAAVLVPLLLNVVNRTEFDIRFSIR